MSIVFLLNLFVWHKNSSNAIPFGTFFALVVMWFGISLPLSVVGAFFGQRKKAIEHPGRTNQIPRQIPEPIWYLRPRYTYVATRIPTAFTKQNKRIPDCGTNHFEICLESYRIVLGGLLPFAVIFIELFFILKSIWEDQYYYMFGFLSLVFIILLVTCVEVSIVVVYFQLCDEVRSSFFRGFFCVYDNMT